MVGGAAVVGILEISLLPPTFALGIESVGLHLILRFLPDEPCHFQPATDREPLGPIDVGHEGQSQIAEPDVAIMKGAPGALGLVHEERLILIAGPSLTIPQSGGEGTALRILIFNIHAAGYIGTELGLKIPLYGGRGENIFRQGGQGYAEVWNQ